MPKVTLKVVNPYPVKSGSKLKIVCNDPKDAVVHQELISAITPYFNVAVNEYVSGVNIVYLKSAGLCGQADLVEIVNGYINITDYKTNKEIKEKGFTNWEGITSKMYNPVSHLDDCNLNHYNLQLSIYAYIIKKHNPKLRVGNLKIQHVKFKQVGTDSNGYPINEHVDGEPVIEDIKMYNLPYLKDEVIQLIKWLKQNK